tara:strand:+ start:9190 stop:9909 length:720 start_codon:yes stop_codon:yes gene_type:complete
MTSVIKPSDIATDRIVFTEVKPMGTSGAKQCYVNYANDKDSGKNSQFPQVVTPKMRLPYGVSVYSEPGKPPRYALQMSFGDMTENSKTKTFYDGIKQIEDKIIQEAMKNSLSWFKKKSITEDVVRTLFCSSIAYSIDKETGEITNKYPPTFKAKIRFWENEFKCIVFDHNKEKIEGDFTTYLGKGQNVSAIIKNGGLWFSGGKFGCTWNVEQLKVDKPQTLIGYAFLDDEDEEQFTTES